MESEKDEPLGEQERFRWSTVTDFLRGLLETAGRRVCRRVCVPVCAHVPVSSIDVILLSVWLGRANLALR